MIDFPVTDTHVHLWDMDNLPYPWLGGHPVLNHSFLVRDLDAARGPVEIERFIFVEAECDHTCSMEEVDWVTGLARHEPRIAGIVARVPVERGDKARPLLEALAASPLVKGVRRIVADETDPGFCLEPGFVAGVRALAEYGFSFDLGVSPGQISSVVRLVEQCPEVQFVLNHIGNPDIRNRQMTPWMIDLPGLADFSNVWCKVSGVATQADHKSWTPDQLKPYVDLVLDVFGPNRVMFGSDWPVALQATTYPRWVEALSDITRDRPPAEIRALFHDNAIECYRLTQ